LELKEKQSPGLRPGVFVCFELQLVMRVPVEEVDGKEVDQSMVDELNAALVLEVDPDFFSRSRWRSNHLMAPV